MNRFKPQYQEGTIIRNTVTSEEFKITNISYDKQLAEIVYNVQNYRFKFNMFKVPEAVIERNAERGRYEIVK